MDPVSLSSCDTGLLRVLSLTSVDRMCTICGGWVKRNSFVEEIGE
jgi:hypothetical protein